MAVVPPMPNARVKMAAAVNIGECRNCLTAYCNFPPRSGIDTPIFSQYEPMRWQVPWSFEFARPRQTPGGCSLDDCETPPEWAIDLGNLLDDRDR